MVLLKIPLKNCLRKKLIFKPCHQKFGMASLFINQPMPTKTTPSLLSSIYNQAILTKEREIHMNDALKQKLADKNKKLIDMVIERAKRDFPEDIALIGLTGSFNTGDFHEKSDLDLIIVNNTERGWEIGSCFILDDVGYDIYCTPWETRLAQQAILENPGVSSLTDLQILYCAKPEYLDKFNALRQQALDMMAKSIGIECITRAKKHIDLAKQNYADVMLSNDEGTIRYGSSQLLYNLVNGIVNINT